MIERFGFDGDSERRRDRLERRLPAPVVRRSAACRCSGSSRPRTWPRSREEKGIPTLVRFFGTRDRRATSSATGDRADLAVGNNVLAHVPELNDFVEGMKVLLAPDGVVTLEFPHLLRLIEETEFDTIYHEHFSYFSLLTVERVFAAHGLRIFDVEELPTHGGSLRIYARHADGASRTSTGASTSSSSESARPGSTTSTTYSRVRRARPRRAKRALREFLERAPRRGPLRRRPTARPRRASRC